jgi:hypothetical protein
MSYSVSAIGPERKYAPVRSFEDSADLSSGELIGSSASLQAVLKRVKIVAPTTGCTVHKNELRRDPRRSAGERTLRA